MNEHRVLPVTDLFAYEVQNPRGQHLGRVEDVAVDVDQGLIAYAVLVASGQMTLPPKRFLVPWSALGIDLEGRKLILDVDQSVFAESPGIDQKTPTGTREYPDEAPPWRLDPQNGGLDV